MWWSGVVTDSFGYWILAWARVRKRGGGQARISQFRVTVPPRVESCCHVMSSCDVVKACGDCSLSLSLPRSLSSHHHPVLLRIYSWSNACVLCMRVHAHRGLHDTQVLCNTCLLPMRTMPRLHALVERGLCTRRDVAHMNRIRRGSRC